MKRTLLFLLLLLVIPLAPATGQQAETLAQEEAAASAAPRPLTIEEYARWRTVESVGISAEGTWVSFAYSKREADDELHLRRLADGHEYVIERATGAVLSDDGRYAAYRLSPGWEEVDKLQQEGERVPVQAALVDLESGETIFTWDDVDRFEMARGGTALAVKRRPADEEAEHDGTDLILVHLDDRTEELLGSVHEFAFNEMGTHLAYTVDAADNNGNGLYVVDLTSGVRRAVDNAKADYARLTWSENGTALAVLRGNKPDGFDERENVLVAVTAATSLQPVKLLFDPADDEGFPADFVVSERGRVAWNEEGTRLFFGIKEQQPEPEKTDEPIADVNIFHWQDDRIQTVQKVQADRDRDFTYVSTLEVATGQFTRLIEEEIRSVEITRDGRWVVAWDPRPYASDWEPPYADIYRIDPATGERTLMLEQQLRTYGLSPDGAHFLYWKDGQMWDWRLDEAATVNLTESAPVSFVDMEWDYFGERPAYGVAGWTADGNAVILEHRYDLWLQPLDGSAATNLTGGAGARDEVIYRYVQLDPDERAIDLRDPQMLAAFGQWTKKSGFFELPPGGGEPLPLVWADKRFGRPAKAREADRLLYTIQDFRQFPDWWIADYALGDAAAGRSRASGTPTYGDANGDDPVASPMATPERITDAVPFQDEYLWGDRILFEYTNDDGVRLQGTLAIPDTYQPGDRLPMIVRFYEQYSQDLHAYPTVRYRHEPNFGDYVSNGYLVMQPDIHFRIGSSHSDMLECVEAATRKVIEMGYAHPAQIGLSGHSYSGGGSSYIAARSDMFAAVASGAAPINLTSEFNQLFLGTGGNNHSYDIYGQGRYGTNPYDDPGLYDYESPITWVREMDTPLLYLHGEEDQIVGYVQGMEWYNALRFNSKPVIFLSYPGEGHGLRQFENQIDFQRRLHEFFDHHLRDEPAPQWMTRGRSYLDKERELRRRR